MTEKIQNVLNSLKDSEALREYIKSLNDYFTYNDLYNLINTHNTIDSLLYYYSVPILKKILEIKDEAFFKFNNIYFEEMLVKYGYRINYFNYQTFVPPNTDEYFSYPQNNFTDSFRESLIQANVYILDDIHGISVKHNDLKTFINLLIKYITELKQFYALNKIRFYDGDVEVDWSFLDNYNNKNLRIDENFIDTYIHTDKAWYYLSNSALKWDFNLLNKYKDRVNWNTIKTLDYINWCPDKLNHFITYLKDKNDLIFIDYLDINIKILNSIPLECWDWKQISQRKNVLWTIELIAEFDKYLCFEELAKNPSVKWDTNLISRYKNVLNFKILCANFSVEWNEEMIESNFHLIEWDLISGNTSTKWDDHLIRKYSSFWKWNVDYEDYATEYTFKSNYSLTSNPSIFWSLEIIDEFVENIDFWSISLFGKVDTTVFEIYSYKFDKLVACGFEYYKFSDNRFTYSAFRNGWHNLTLNKNFYITLDNIRFFYNKKITLIEPDGNLAYSEKYKENTYRILEILKSCPIKDLTIDEVIKYELSWGSVLLNKEFINNDIWEKLIAPIFTDVFIINYVTKLNAIFNNKNCI